MQGYKTLVIFYEKKIYNYQIYREKYRVFLSSKLTPTMLEYVIGLMGLGWQYSPLVLGLIRDKGRLLRGQVNLSI